jgi:hypothetical protein
MASRIISMDGPLARLLAGSLLSAALVAGCVGVGGEPSPTGPVATGSPAANGFYLRAWRTQAVEPRYTFGWLPSVTISDGQYISGMVAVPAIYPGPIYVGLSSRSISARGIDMIVAEARKDGLLGAQSDFPEGGMPRTGSITAHVQLVVDGVTYELTGALPSGPGPDSAPPGTAAAFASFWSRLETLDAWLATELRPSTPYTPTRIAAMLTPPTEASGGIAPNETPWPLTSTFATFGQPYGGSVYRCATVTGTDLATLQPVIQASNQLTRFVDSTGAKASLQARVLVPGESGPCA